MARNTEGSQRVIVPKHTRTTSAPTTRPRQAEPAQQRGEQRQHERDVLSRDRSQVGEPGGPELRGERVGHAPRVAEKKPGEQRPIGGIEVLRTREHQGARIVGRPGERRMGGPSAEHVGGVERADRVLPPPARVESLELGEPAAEHDRLPRRQEPQMTGDVARRGDEHPSSPCAAVVHRRDAHERPGVEARGVGIVDQRGDDAGVDVAFDCNA